MAKSINNIEAYFNIKPEIKIVKTLIISGEKKITSPFIWGH